MRLAKGGFQPNETVYSITKCYLRTVFSSLNVCFFPLGALLDMSHQKRKHFQLFLLISKLKTHLQVTFKNKSYKVLKFGFWLTATMFSSLLSSFVIPCFFCPLFYFLLQFSVTCPHSALLHPPFLPWWQVLTPSISPISTILFDIWSGPFR